mmetsp:Transcript_35221/g.98955  ORF Transcript_35221/g.98955 Transcript_35221/m.98955 type:complete len:210 (+) Transcript_35221:954-1583(+)
MRHERVRANVAVCQLRYVMDEAYQLKALTGTLSACLSNHVTYNRCWNDRKAMIMLAVSNRFGKAQNLKLGRALDNAVELGTMHDAADDKLIFRGWSRLALQRLPLQVVQRLPRQQTDGFSHASHAEEAHVICAKLYAVHTIPVSDAKLQALLLPQLQQARLLRSQRGERGTIERKLRMGEATESLDNGHHLVLLFLLLLVEQGIHKEGW